MAPDLVWRCRGDMAEIAEGDDIAAGRFRPDGDGALESLRDLVARSRLDLPRGLPPMAAGVFGVIGYDMIRLVEKLPDINPDPLDLPDGVLIRPSIVAIFDGVAQEIILVTTVRPSAIAPEAAYAAAQGRIGARDRGAEAAAAARPAAESGAAAGRLHLAGQPRGLRRDRRAGQGLHPRRRHLPGGAQPPLQRARSRTIRSRSTGRCGAPTPRRSCSSSTSRTSS